MRQVKLSAGINIKDSVHANCLPICKIWHFYAGFIRNKEKLRYSLHKTLNQSL